MHWVDIQCAFLQEMQQQDNDTPAIVEDTIPAAARFQIYRNNITLTLIDALAETYRAIYQLVGEEYFTLLAKQYIAQHPARSANLSDYGKEFAEFLMNHPVREQLPYLLDMAQFEWAWQRSFYAQDATLADLSALATMTPEAQMELHITFHPSLQLLALDYPADAIWEFCIKQQGEGEAPPTDKQTRWLAVYRDTDGIQTVQLMNDWYDTLNTLKVQTIGESIEMALSRNNAFDTEGFLTLLFQHKWISAINE